MKAEAPRLFLIAAGLSGALAVTLGAVSAHLADPAITERLATAVRYLMWHALALLAVSWLCNGSSRPWAVFAGLLFVTGQILFCGSLILSSLVLPQGIAVLAPFGGLAFIAGWLCLAMAGIRAKS